uniref:Uncharacterized protein n=1 Tax=Anguilla anguilla TaxID=7936 RepID=A0A0E9RHV1_ANGAN
MSLTALVKLFHQKVCSFCEKQNNFWEVTTVGVLKWQQPISPPFSFFYNRT